MIVSAHQRQKIAEGDREKRSGSKIDFIADEKRLNVALSRAKKLLIIIGDMEFYTGRV